MPYPSQSDRMNHKVLPDISVILPVFDSEAYISHSLDCLVGQTFSNCEFLIIDDGSTDRTGIICDEYSKLDTRIRVFHKPNGGVASARQLGIEHARGKYSIHFDADDTASHEMLAEMYKTAIDHDADVVIADFYEKMSDGSVRYVNQSTSSQLSSDFLIDILERRLFGALWHKLIRTSLYFEKGISFNPHINYCEDVLVEAKMFKDDDVKVVHHPHAYYTYCHDNPDSITVNYNLDKLKMRIAFLDELKTVLDCRKFNHAFEATVWDVKMEAYRHDILKFEDIATCYPNSIKFLLHTNFTRRQRLRLVLNTLLH